MIINLLYLNIIIQNINIKFYLIKFYIKHEIFDIIIFSDCFNDILDNK